MDPAVEEYVEEAKRLMDEATAQAKVESWPANVLRLEHQRIHTEYMARLQNIGFDRKQRNLALSALLAHWY